MNKMKIVVVAGATGFIGKQLTKKLLINGLKVYAIGTNQSKLDNLKKYGNVVLIQAKFEDYENILDYIDKKDNIDAFINLAWNAISSNLRNDYNIQINNIQPACLTMEIAKKLKVKKYIFTSTFSCYRYINKNDHLVNLHVYDIAKKATEDILKSMSINYDIDYNAIKLSSIFGPGDNSNATFFIKELVNGNSLNLINGENLYDFTYIDDTVDGIIAVCEKGLNLKSYYLGRRKIKTFKELLKEMRDAINTEIELNFGAFVDDSFIDYSQINLDELYNDTGFECTCDFKKSVLKTADWLKKERSDI